VAFRETIEAILKVKDANRFKAGMDRAARSVRKFGHDEEAAAAQTELLERIANKMERQSYELTAALELVAHSVDELGDEMVQTAAKAQLLNVATKKSGSNAVFLGKSWAFWKDRLSLTRSEIMTTSLTIAAYFSPAIIALGSSFAYAAIGGGGVAAAGLATFVFGLVGLSTVIKPVISNLKKIKTAQDLYNLTVQQYGANSEQASRQAAHLYGVVQTQGGAPMLKASQNLAKFKKEWSAATKPARGSILSIISGGTSTLRNLTPMLASGVNQMAVSLQQGLGGLFKVLQGTEMKATFRVMAETWDRSIGPGIKGATNVLVVFSRIIRAAAPWVVKLADAWARTTQSWKDSTSDQSKVQKFLDGAVTHFKAWWGLTKAIGRVLRTIFSVSKDEGLGFVYTLTNIVNRFDAWLNKLKDTGQITAFWRIWKQSVTDVFDFLTHPDTWITKLISAINRWLPVLLDKLAIGITIAAPIVAVTFAKAFLNSGAWAQFFVVAFFLKKFGFFKYLGSLVADMFIAPFIAKFGKAFAASLGLQFAEEGAISTAMGTAGTRLGDKFGKAFKVAAVGAMIVLTKEFGDWLSKQAWYKKAITGGGIDKSVGAQHGQVSTFLGTFLHPTKIPGAVVKSAEDLGSLLSHLFQAPVPRHHAIGGTIPPGGSGIVGESGMEFAQSGPFGTTITPLSAGSSPDLQGALHITVHSHVNVDKREIARAVTDQAVYDTTRRGGLRRPR
jgi:hypothetical protein